MKSAAIFSTAAGILLLTAPAAPDKPNSAATAAAPSGPSSPAGQTPPGEPAAAPELKPLDAETIPTEKSPLPTPAEWSAATRVKLSRMGPAAPDCRAYRVREWLRVRCPDVTAAAISLLGGNQEGIVFWIDPPKSKNSEMPGGGEVMFPLRRGDRRVFQISTFGQGYDGPFTILPAAIIQEQWTDGEPAPIVTVM